MKKRDYDKPSMKVVKMRQRKHLMSGSIYETTGKTRLNAMGDEEDL